MKLSQLITSDYFKKVESSVENFGFVDVKTNIYSVVPILNIAFTNRVNYKEYKYYCSDFLYSRSYIKKLISRFFVFFLYFFPRLGRLFGYIVKKEMKIITGIDVVTFGNHRVRFHNVLAKNSIVVPFSTDDVKYTERCVRAYKEMSLLVNIPKVVEISKCTYVEDQLEGVPFNRINIPSFKVVGRYIENFIDSNRSMSLQNVTTSVFSRYKRAFIKNNVNYSFLANNLNDMLFIIDKNFTNLAIMKSHGDLNCGNVYVDKFDRLYSISVIDWEFYSYRIEKYDHFIFFSNIRHLSCYKTAFNNYCDKYYVDKELKLLLLFEDYLFRSSNLGDRYITESEEEILNNIFYLFKESVG